MNDNIWTKCSIWTIPIMIATIMFLQEQFFSKKGDMIVPTPPVQKNYWSIWINANININFKYKKVWNYIWTKFFYFQTINYKRI